LKRLKSWRVEELKRLKRLKEVERGFEGSKTREEQK